MWKASLLLLFAMAPAACARTIAVKWNQTPIAFAGKTVVVELADGATLQGHWIEVSPQSFTMQVERTSKRRLHPRGLGTFDRAKVLSIALIRGRKAGRDLGTTVGILSGTYIGRVLGENSAAGERAIFPLMAAGGIIGHIVGSAIDKDQLRVTILPD